MNNITYQYIKKYDIPEKIEIGMVFQLSNISYRYQINDNKIIPNISEEHLYKQFIVITDINHDILYNKTIYTVSPIKRIIRYATMCDIIWESENHPLLSKRLLFLTISWNILDDQLLDDETYYICKLDDKLIKSIIIIREYQQGIRKSLKKLPYSVKTGDLIYSELSNKEKLQKINHIKEKYSYFENSINNLLEVVELKKSTLEIWKETAIQRLNKIKETISKFFKLTDNGIFNNELSALSAIGVKSSGNNFNKRKSIYNEEILLNDEYKLTIDLSTSKKDENILSFYMTIILDPEPSEKVIIEVYDKSNPVIKTEWNNYETNLLFEIKENDLIPEYVIEISGITKISFTIPILHGMNKI